MKEYEAKQKFSVQMAVRESIMWSVGVNFNYTKYFYSIDPWKDGNPHLAYISFNFFKILVIDAAKLFVNKKSQKFNLFELLKNLENGEFEILGFPKNRLEYFSNKLLSFKEVIDSIEKYRNKLFAHTDHMATIGPGPLFFKSVEELISLGYDFMNETTFSLTDKQIHSTLNKTDLTNLKIN